MVLGHGVESGSNRDDCMTKNDHACAFGCKVPCPKDICIYYICSSKIGDDGDAETQKVDDQTDEAKSRGDLVAHVDGGGSHDGEIGHGHLVGQIGRQGAAPGTITITIGEVRPGDVSEVPSRHFVFACASELRLCTRVEAEEGAERYG